MRVFEINSVPYGSTGTLMFALADMLRENSHEVKCTAGFTWSGSGRDDFFVTSNIFEKEFHTVLSKITGRNGHYSYFATKRLIEKIKAFAPDIIHIHNIHGWYLNFPLFFDFVKSSGVPIVWTLHDCFAFTGGCAHFSYVKCRKWQCGCGDCPQLSRYPESFIDRTSLMLREKLELFADVPELTLVSPSVWLAGLVKESFLREYPMRVINNGINTEIFKKTENNFRKKYGIKEKYIVLGVILGYDVRKGIDVFARLSEMLPEDYKIVIVGADSKSKRYLPKSILSLCRVDSAAELANIYSAADVFVNPTREDTYPTVNMEAVACGTPVVTFDACGSTEMISEHCGRKVTVDDIDSMCREITDVCESAKYEPSRLSDIGKGFDKKYCLEEYRKLFEEIYDRASKERI